MTTVESTPPDSNAIGCGLFSRRRSTAWTSNSWIVRFTSAAEFAVVKDRTPDFDACARQFIAAIVELQHRTGRHRPRARRPR